MILLALQENMETSVCVPSINEPDLSRMCGGNGWSPPKLRRNLTQPVQATGSVDRQRDTHVSERGRWLIDNPKLCITDHDHYYAIFTPVQFGLD
jgi:hypothetical protein